jgi:hypothetical protein
MQMKVLIFIFLLTGFLDVHAAEVVYLRGSISPLLSMSLTGRLQQGKYIIKAHENADFDHFTLCKSIEVPDDKTIFAQVSVIDSQNDLTLVIEASGYKTYQINRQIKETENRLIVDVGAIVLEPIDLPFIKEIILAYNEQGDSRYRIEVKNSFGKQFIISTITVKLRLNLTQKSNFLFSTDAPISKFTIAPSIGIQANNLNIPIGLPDNSGYYSIATGTIRHQQGADDVTLEFSFLTTLPVEKSSSTFFDIIIPSKFKVDDNGKSDEYLVRHPSSKTAFNFNSSIEKFGITLFTLEEKDTKIEKEI